MGEDCLMGNLKDYATSTVLTAPSPATSGTSLVVQSGHGARFPATPFYVTVHPPSELPTIDNAEKLLVSSKSTDTFTITRAQGDTTAKSIEAGWRISNSLFLADIPVIDSTSVDAAGATMNSDTNVKTNSWVVDEDNMSSNLDTKLPTQQSVKAYIDAAISSAKESLLPVGSIVVLGVSTNPATLYGFGTWTAITGRVLVGKAASGTFGTLDATGGAETHTLSAAEMPSHTHWDSGHTHTINAYTTNNEAGGYGLAGNSGFLNRVMVNQSGGQGSNTGWASLSYAGSSGAHNNLQPYIVKYMWQRTA